MSSTRLQTFRSTRLSWLLCVTAIAACSRKIPEPEAIPAEPTRAELEKTATRSEPAPAPPQDEQPPKLETVWVDGQERIKRRPPDPGFNPLSLNDNLPFCVFPNQEARVSAPYLKDVKPQKLVANSKVTFGVFGPWCLNADCDDRPNLQCWTEQQGDDTIIVKTKFFSFHKEGSECTEECLDLDTSCNTQIELKAGKKYTIRHGDKTYKLQVPGVIKDPCFGVKR